MTKKSNFKNLYISCPIFSGLFEMLTDSECYLFPHIPPNIFLPPVLTEDDRELLKMFLWYDLYVYLSDTFKINSKEEYMFKPKLICSLLLELVKDGEHTLKGIENATRIPLEVLEDIIYEINPNPSASVSATIIGYYIIAKRQGYTEFIRKVFQWVEYQYTKTP